MQTDVNPKETEGLKKIPYSYVPAGPIAALALAMYEGKKYARHNYRVMGNIKSSIYYDAFNRHVHEWWEGEDIDKHSGLDNLWKAMACLTILIDAKMTGRLEDDRPPKLPTGWLDEMNKYVGMINERVTKLEPPFTETNYKKRLPISLQKDNPIYVMEGEPGYVDLNNPPKDYLDGWDGTGPGGA